MHGLMMNYPLTLTSILKRARDLFADGQIATREPGGVHHYTYGDFYERVLRLMGALKAAGVKPGDRVGTFAWNRYQHLELYFAVPCLGAVLHTLNIRLSTDQLTYLVNHAEDRMIFVDESLAEQLAPLQEHCKGVERFVVMREGGNETLRPARRNRIRGFSGRRHSRWPSYRNSTRTPPAPCATRPEPPAIPRVRCTATAACTCTPWPSVWPT